MLHVQGAVKQHFKEDFNNLFKHLLADGGGRVTDDNMRSLLFGDYMNPDAVGHNVETSIRLFPFLVLSLFFPCLPYQETKLYEEVASLDDLTGVVETALEEYNNTHKNRMDLVIFRYIASLI